MRNVGLLAGFLLVCLLAAPGAADAQDCHRTYEGQWLPHAHLTVQNRTAGWVRVDNGRHALIGRIPPHRVVTFRHALAPGRYYIFSELAIERRIFEARHLVYFNNEGQRTCNRVMQLVLTGATYPSAGLPDRTQPTRYYVWYMPQEFTCCRDPRSGQTPHPIRYGPQARMPAGARVLGGPFGDEGNMRAFMCRHDVRKARAWIQNYAFVNGVLVSNLPCTAS